MIAEANHSLSEYQRQSELLGNLQGGFRWREKPREEELLGGGQSQLVRYRSSTEVSFTRSATPAADYRPDKARATGRYQIQPAVYPHARSKW